MDKSELIRTMRESHDRLAESIRLIPDERLLELATDTWSGKDVVAHLAWWHDHSARVVESLRAGREPYDRTDPASGLDTVNDRTFREHRDDPPAAVRRAFDESFARLLAALDPCTEEELFTASRWPWVGDEPLVETIRWDTSRHYDDHRKHLERLSL